MIRHALTIDLEEQFQLSSAGHGVPERHWERFPARLDRNVDAALKLLDRHSARATFFVGPWVASRHGPQLADIAGEGHEIACVIDTSPRRGAASASDAAVASSNLISLIESASGHIVHGCRTTKRARRSSGDECDTVSKAFRYSLRLGPFAASDDVPSAAPRDHARIVIPGLRMAGHDFALRSGTSLRLMPDALANRFIAGWARCATPRIFDFKLWELDPNPTELSILSPLQRRLCYRNLALFENRLGDLLDQGTFAPLREQLGLVDAPTPQPMPTRVTTRETGDADAQPSPAESPITIIVPCYNEEAGLPYLANALASLAAGLGRRHGLTFVLVDDGSTDRTWSEMQRLFAADARFRLVHHDRNRGVGAAILTGIAKAGTEVVAVIDSDCSYDPARIEEMLPLLAPDVALVTASPYHAEGGVEGVPEWRLFLSRGASRLYRMVLRNKLATYTSCFRVIRKGAIEGLVLRHEGFIGVAEMLARLDLRGWKIAEHPMVLEARLIGRSKLRIVRVILGHLGLLAEVSIARLMDLKRPETAPKMRGEG